MRGIHICYMDMVKKYNQKEQRDGKGFLSPSHLAVVFDSVWVCFPCIFIVPICKLVLSLLGRG